MPQENGLPLTGRSVRSARQPLLIVWVPPSPMPGATVSSLSLGLPARTIWMHPISLHPPRRHGALTNHPSEKQKTASTAAHIEIKRSQGLAARTTAQIQHLS